MSASQPTPLSQSLLLVRLAGFSAGLAVALRILLPEEPLLSPWPAGWPALAAGVAVTLALLGIGALRFGPSCLALIACTLAAALLTLANPGDWPGGSGAGRAALVDALLFSALALVALRTWRDAAARNTAGRFLVVLLVLAVAWALFDALGGRALRHDQLLDTLRTAELQASESARALSASERARGPFSHSGALATSLLLLTPLALCRWTGGLRRRSTLDAPSQPQASPASALILAALFMGAFVASGSLGAWLALGLAALYHRIRAGRHPGEGYAHSPAPEQGSASQKAGDSSPPFRRPRTALALGICLLLAPSFSSHGGLPGWLSTKASALEARLGYLSWLPDCGAHSWLFGIGPGRTGEWAELLTAVDQPASRSLHSGWLQVILENGFGLGLLALAPLFVVLLVGLGVPRPSLRAAASSDPEAPASATRSASSPLDWTHALIGGAAAGWLLAPLISPAAGPFFSVTWNKSEHVVSHGAALLAVSFLWRRGFLPSPNPSPFLLRTALLGACLHLCLDVSLEIGAWRALAALAVAWSCAQLAAASRAPDEVAAGREATGHEPRRRLARPWVSMGLGLCFALCITLHTHQLHTRDGLQVALPQTGAARAAAFPDDEILRADPQAWLLARAATLPQHPHPEEELRLLLELGGKAWLQGGRTGESSPRAAALALRLAERFGHAVGSPLFERSEIGAEELSSHPLGLLLLAQAAAKGGAEGRARAALLAGQALSHAQARCLLAEERETLTALARAP